MDCQQHVHLNKTHTVLFFFQLQKTYLVTHGDLLKIKMQRERTQTWDFRDLIASWPFGQDQSVVRERPRMVEKDRKRQQIPDGKNSQKFMSVMLSFHRAR